MAASKVLLTAAALGLALGALAGCAADEALDTTGPTPTASVSAAVTDSASSPAGRPVPTPPADEQDACTELAEVTNFTGGWHYTRTASLKDRGAREFAEGEVAVGADDAPQTYTVAPGDVASVVAERLCAYPDLAALNHVRTIHPGQVLWLTPDPDIPWIPYTGPAGAGADFPQIPYQHAIEAAGRAVDAGDLGAVRKIWRDTLSGMFLDQTLVRAVQNVVDAGDLDGLRQIFS